MRTAMEHRQHRSRAPLGLRASGRPKVPAADEDCSAGSPTEVRAWIDMPPLAEQGVERLYRDYRLSLVRLAVLLVDDRETAEDVVQEAFAGLHRRWSVLHSEDAALGYLRASVVNGARSVLRRRRTVRRHPAADERALTAEAADAGALLADEHREVLAAIAQLPARQREVIVLRYWADLTDRQIADALGLSLGGVKSTASRGRDAIASMLGGRR
jgi:RNA polymerase sigma-70 factor (sigma-E family)